MEKQSTISKEQHVTTGRRKEGKLVAVKSYQATRYHHHKQVVTDVMSPAPNGLALTNGSQIKYFLEADAVRPIKSVTLRFHIRMDTADDELAPVPYWFDLIEIYDRHTGQQFSVAYNDTLFAFMNVIHQDQLEQWQDLANYDAQGFTRSRKVQKTGDTRYYYLPLVASMFEGMHLDMTSISTDIEIRLHPISGGPTINGVGTPVLLEVAGLYEVEMTDEINQRAHKSFLNSHVPIHYYLDTQQYVETGVTMNASTKYEFDLDQFNHLSAALLVVIRR